MSTAAKRFLVRIPADNRGLSILKSAVALAQRQELRLLAMVVDDERLTATASLPFTLLQSYGGSTQEEFDLSVTQIGTQVFRNTARQTLERFGAAIEWSLIEPQQLSDEDDAADIEVCSIVDVERRRARSCVTIIDMAGSGGVCAIDEGLGEGLQIAADLAVAQQMPLVILGEQRLTRALAQLETHKLPVTWFPVQTGVAQLLAKLDPAYLVLDRCADQSSRQELTSALISRTRPAKLP